MAVKTQFRAGQARRGRPRRGVAADRKFAADRVAVEADAQNSKQDGKIVADAVDVLLHVDQLLERCDSVVAQEVVVGGRVDTRARTTNIVGSRRGIVVSSVTLEDCRLA